MLNKKLPVDIVLAPEWWHKNAGICFDKDFFFHPLRRVEDERKMEDVLYEKWGRFGLGENKGKDIPEIGAVHLAAGYMLSEMLGCKVEYNEGSPPRVVAANRDDLLIKADSAFESDAFKNLQKLLEKLKEKYNYLSGDINWGGVMNIAMDIRGEAFLMDMMMSPDETKVFLDEIGSVITRFTNYIQNNTATTSISVNRNLRHIENPVLLHSECSHTMISTELYEEFLLTYDIAWSREKRPFGIHYCGNDPHRYAESFAKIPYLDFLDLGWGGDIKLLRKHLPNTFLNIRLSPVEIINQSTEEIRNDIIKLVKDSGNPYLTGVCCVNIDDKIEDEKISTIFQTVEELKQIS